VDTDKGAEDGKPTRDEEGDERGDAEVGEWDGGSVGGAGEEGAARTGGDEAGVWDEAGAAVAAAAPAGTAAGATRNEAGAEGVSRTRGGGRDGSGFFAWLARSSGVKATE
jgi:hypothetical protein